jgi:uncharacterized protein with HEPN domain
MAKRTDEASILDILYAADMVATYLKRVSRKKFDRDPMLRDAVARQIGIIGEAAANLSPGFKDAHPDQPWRQIIAMRNLVVHAYWDIDFDVVWQAAREDVPALAEYLRDALDVED